MTRTAVSRCLLERNDLAVRLRGAPHGKLSLYARYAPCRAPPSDPLSRKRRVTTATSSENDGLVVPTPFNGEKQIRTWQFPVIFRLQPAATGGFCRLLGSITTSTQRFRRTCAHLCCLWSPARPPLTSQPLTRRLSDASDEPRPPSPAPSRPSTMMCVHTHGCRRASDTSPLTRIVCVHDAPLLLALSYLTSIVPISRATHTLATPSDIPRPNPYPTPCTPPSVHPTSHTIPLYEPYELLL